MDQLLNIVTWLATEIKNMKTEIAEVKSSASAVQEPSVIEPLDMDEPVVRNEPYKVIPIESITVDEWWVNPMEPKMKKVYRGIWRTFKSKAEALKYLDAVQARNPGQKYDIFPV